MHANKFLGQSSDKVPLTLNMENGIMLEAGVQNMSKMPKNYENDSANEKCTGGLQIQKMSFEKM